MLANLGVFMRSLGAIRVHDHFDEARVCAKRRRARHEFGRDNGRVNEKPSRDRLSRKSRAVCEFNLRKYWTVDAFSV